MSPQLNGDLSLPRNVLQWIQTHTHWVPFGTPLGFVAAFGVKGSAGMGVGRKEKWLGLESLLLTAPGGLTRGDLGYLLAVGLVRATSHPG